MHFNLIEEPWIPLLRPDGTVENVGLRYALNNAAKYERIESGHGVTDQALLRLMLSVVHRATSGPVSSQAAAAWIGGGFPAGVIDTYLDRPEIHGRFDLFGEMPFMQVGDLPTVAPGGVLDVSALQESDSTEPSDPDDADADEEVPADKVKSWTDPVLRLQQEHWKENNTSPHWRMRSLLAGDRISRLTPARAALALITYMPNALKGTMRRVIHSSKANPLEEVYTTTVVGQDLHATLCLNATPYEADLAAADAPLWEQKPLTFDELQRLTGALPGGKQQRIPARGRTHRMTWPTRSIRLLPVEERGETVVREVALAGGLTIDLPGHGGGRDVDPMVALYSVKKKDELQILPWKMQSRDLGQSLWRNLLNLMPGEGRTPPGVVTHARDVMRALRSRPPADLSFEERLALRRASGGSAVPLLRTQVLGTASTNAKMGGTRSFRVDLPQAYLDQPARFADLLSDPLREAEKTAAQLNSATRKLAEETLAQRHRRQNIDKPVHHKDVSEFAKVLTREGLFWAELSVPFAELLAGLDVDDASAIRRWRIALRRSALSAWDRSVEAAGTGSVGLRAEVLARPILDKHLRTLSVQETP